MKPLNRRPIKTRSHTWVLKFASYLNQIGLSPNQISVIGVGISFLGALSMVVVESIDTSTFFAGGLLFFAAVTVQFRLLCNMMDGIVATEFGKKSKLGDLFNEVPDRIEDTLFLVAAGYATGTPAGMVFGWLAALCAIGTAYLRLLGGLLGFEQDFSGPAAKPQRMFLLTVTLIIAAFQTWLNANNSALTYGLFFILAGTLITILRRLRTLAKNMNQR